MNWTNPGNAVASDNIYATMLLSSSTVTVWGNFLQVTNFGFSIPTGATINGITVGIERKVSSTSFNPKDHTVKLVKGGTIQGNNKASASVYPTSDAYATYGSSSDLWGLTLTDTDVNASTFGVAISCQCDVTAKSATAFSIDHIRITVDYTVSSGATPTVATKSIGRKRVPSYLSSYLKYY